MVWIRPASIDSKAALQLKAPWRRVKFSTAVPQPLRDEYYPLVSRTRDRPFAKRTVRLVLSSEPRAKFIYDLASPA